MSCSSSTPAHGVSVPVITTQPADLTTTAGTPATFTVAASGTGVLTFQWSKGASAIAGATGAAYMIPATVAADAGSYSVVVSNGAGSATSTPATLTVTPAPVAPTITTQPAATMATAGAPAAFTVAATGTAPFSYQWSKDGTVIPGATAATYALAAVVPADAGAYSVVVTNSMGHVASTSATLTVNLPPVIVTQPAGLTVISGQPATFTVAATGTAPLVYQWYKGTVAVGGNAATLTIPATVAGDAGVYTVAVSNVARTVTSAAATLVVTVLPPTITTQPLPATVVSGQPATFTVAVTGTGPFTYQWKKDGTNVGGSTATLTVAATTPADAGAYTVTVTNAAASVTSAAAALVVNTAVAFTTQPADATVLLGQPASFTVAVTGTAPFAYQWNLNGTAIPGATAATYPVAAAAMADAGAYTATVTNPAGSRVSNAATLTVTAPPVVITAHPVSVAVQPPDGATFTVAATGSNLTYRWRKNGSVITGATGTTYSVPATDLHNVADVYSASVTGDAGTVESNGATLTVTAPKPVYAGDPTAPGNPNYSTWSSWYTTAPADNLGSFRFGYDTGKVNPLWSASCFFPSAPWAFTRPSTYPDDPRIVGAAVTGDYTNTGWSRGHQTGFADLRDVYGADAGASTMYVSNMCPQDQTFNGGEWQNFENLCTLTYPAAFGRVWVYTGPIFNVQLVSPIGPKNMAVPNAFYKIMVRETAGVPKVLAAIVPQSSTLMKPGVAMTDADFWKFVTTVDRVQELTGLTFFPTPATPLPANFTSTIDVASWGGPLRQGPNKPNVHMITPSWDSEFKHVHNSTNVVTLIDVNTALIGAPVAFKALAVPDPDAIASTTWTFGDGASDTSLVTSHAYSTAGDFTVTFSATDTASHTSSVSRVITIVGSNSAPVFTPSVLPGVNVLFNATGTQNFTVADDTTPVAAVAVTATSGNLTLLPAANLTVAYASGTWTLTMIPVAGQSGTALVTVTATDQDGAATIKTFNFTVAPAVVVGTAKLIISQYYEGTSNNKWIEITNVGTGTYDAAVSTIYVGLWANPKSASNPYTTAAVAGTIAPGESILLRNSGSVLPANAYNGGATSAKNGAKVISSAIANFNGNDVVFLSTTAASSTTDATAYANRTDAIGAYIASTDQTLWNWDPITPIVIPTGWGAVAPPGQDRSYVRNFNITSPNPTYTPTEWTMVDAVQITATALGLCETVTATDSRYLGYHSYSGGNP